MSGNSLLLQGQQSAKAASGGLETKAANGSDALTNNAQKTQNGPYDEDGDLSAHLVKWGGHIASKNRNPGNLRYAGIGWDGWKERNKQGLDCEVTLERKGNQI